MIFSLRESDIETCGFSDIIFAIKLGEAQYHSALAEYHCAAILNLIYIIVLFVGIIVPKSYVIAILFAFSLSKSA